MTANRFSTAVLFVFIIAISLSSARAQSIEFCWDVVDHYTNREYTAKVPLYDTKIQETGIKKLERDNEEIPRGAELVVMKVRCGKSATKFKLRALEHGGGKTKVEIHFKFRPGETSLESDLETFEKMVGYVFELPEDESE